MHRIDVPSATPDNEFTEGSPTGGVPATTVSADWLNDIQEEIMSVLTNQGIAPIKGVQDQLLQAIIGISGDSVPAATTTVAGILMLATQALVDAGTNNNSAVTPLTLNTLVKAGFSILLGANGYIVFPTIYGGLKIQWGQTTNIAAGSHVNVTFPIPFTSALYHIGGTFATVADSTTPIGIGFGAGPLTNADVYNRNSGGITATAYYLVIGK